MFTPIGFFAPTGGAPLAPWQSKLTGYFDANQDTGTTTWTDLTGNGNNASYNSVGSGGGASVTHVGGTTPYWEFSSPNPTTEQAKMDTAYVLGGISTTTPWTWWVVNRQSTLSITSNLWRAVDAGDDAWGLGVNAANNMFQNIRAGSSSNLNSIITLNSTNFYITVVVADGTSYKMYTNGFLQDTDTNLLALDISAVLSVGATFLSNSNQNNFQWAAGGWVVGDYYDSTDLSDIYNYYNAIYSF